MIIAKANNNYLRLIEKVESWKKNDYYSRIVTNNRIFDYSQLIEFLLLAKLIEVLRSIHLFDQFNKLVDIY